MAEAHSDKKPTTKMGLIIVPALGKPGKTALAPGAFSPKAIVTVAWGVGLGIIP